MADTDKILKEKLDRLSNVPSDLIKKIEKAEQQLVKDINLVIGQLDRDSAGTILTNERNLAIIDTIRPELERVFEQSAYIDAVRDFAKEFDKQSELNSKYYEELLAYTESSAIVAMSKQSKKKAVSLLLQGAVDQSFYDPIVNAISEAVYTNAPFAETSKTIGVLIAGGEINGSIIKGGLSRYAGQVAYDAMAIADRTYNQQVVKETEVQFYQYTGGTIEDTREFCEERNGNYYHIKEIESWADLEWQGKYRGTSRGTIFNYLGGYNCRHSIIPVPISMVPLSDIRRNLSNGNLRLTDREKDILGL